MGESPSVEISGDDAGDIPEIASLSRRQRWYDRPTPRLDAVGVLKRQPIAQARDDPDYAEPAIAVRGDSVRPVTGLAPAQAHLAEDTRSGGGDRARGAVRV